MDIIVVQITLVALDVALGAIALSIARTALKIAKSAQEAVEGSKEANAMALKVVNTLEPRLIAMESKLDAVVSNHYH